MEKEFSKSTRMFKRSGEMQSENLLVAFLYLLARDHLPLGEIETLVNKSSGAIFNFSNGWLAAWAIDAAARLEWKKEGNEAVTNLAAEEK